jgi:HAD superfamily hydrolase (TIGR01549 family)
MLKAVLLDIDGTLIDSNNAHARTWVEAFAKFGIRASLTEVRDLVGMGGDHLVPKLTGLPNDSRLSEKLKAEKDRLFSEQIPTLKAFHGARDLLSRIRKNGLSIVAATSSGSEMAEKLLSQAAVRDLIDEIASADDAAHSKPNSDIVHAALQKMRIRAEEAIMLGDTPYDVKAATSAGVEIIGFLCGGWSRSDLRGSIAVYDGPADLYVHLDSSPLRNGVQENLHALT